MRFLNLLLLRLDLGLLLNPPLLGRSDVAVAQLQLFSNAGLGSLFGFDHLFRQLFRRLVFVTRRVQESLSFWTL